MPEDEGRSRRELEVLDQLSTLLIMTSGYATPGLDEIGARMHELCRRIDDTGLLAHALWRLGIFYLAACELETAATVAEQLLEQGEARADPGAVLLGHMALGLVRTHGGELTAGREHIDRAVEMCDAGHDRAVTASVAESPAVLNRVYAAWNWSLTSDGDEAVTALTEALAEAGKEGGQSYAMTYAITFAAVVHTLRREVD